MCAQNVGVVGIGGREGVMRGKEGRQHPRVGVLSAFGRRTIQESEVWAREGRGGPLEYRRQGLFNGKRTMLVESVFEEKVTEGLRD